MAIVGIDLGTTTSEVAIYRNGTAEILRDREGNEIIASVVTIDNRQRSHTIGERAKASMLSDPALAVEEIKRKMGTSERVQLGNESYLPQEISAMILRYLKEAAEEQLGETVDRAVITVPANFPDTARQATKAAGELAGLKVERIINEPTAAALAYGFEEDMEEEVVMIYDLGGGTFDVSVVEYDGDILDVQASAGDPHLGGKDFDRALLEYVAQQFEAQSGIKAALDPSHGGYYRLLYACEKAKKELSFNTSTRVLIPFFTVQDGQPVTLDVEISRRQFEKLIGGMIDRTEQSIDRALKDAGLSRSDVDRVLLVGGSTRIPYVRDLVERVIDKKPLTNVDPDRAVALGAAVQAAIIDGEAEQIIMDVCPLSLGTAVLVDVGGMYMPGKYSEIIEPNKPQLKAFTQKYLTVVENQQVIDFRVYQRSNESVEAWAELGDEPNTAGGFNLLATQRIQVPPGPKGQEVKATYTYNLNGIVLVKIEIGNSGISEEFEVVTLQDSAALEASQERLSKLWQASAYYDEVRATLYAAEKKLDDGLEASAQNELTALIAALKAALAKDDGADVRRLENLLTDLLFDLD